MQIELSYATNEELCMEKPWPGVGRAQVKD